MSVTTNKPPSPAPVRSATSRVQSIDILRGLVMVLMALDHVREFWSATPYRLEDPAQTSGVLFFTRWVTHFCAPTFIFLSGISVFLYARKQPDRRKVSWFLLTRGLWLVVLEVSVINFLWQFEIQLVLLQVIWVIGWSMILMAPLIWLPRWAVAGLALALIAGHNLLPDFQPVTAANVGWALLHHSPFLFQTGAMPPVLVAYTLIPWVGVLMAGYLIGPWFTDAFRQRAYRLRLSGAILLLTFVLLRLLNGYGDPAPWSPQPRGAGYSVLSFLNVSKYPPSLLFLCLTLGMALLALSVLERPSQRSGKWLQTYGQVPFFFYLLHIPLISAGAFGWSLLAFGRAVNFSFTPADAWPASYQPDLLRLYLVWLAVVVLLYFPCRWYGRFRQRHAYWWLSYL